MVSIASPTPNPLVSVIIPTWNCGAFIAEAIDSALAQTYRPLEVIVGDDGSTDDTGRVVAAYGDRVRYLLLPHRGSAPTRNALLASCQGKFIANLDSDDLWLPEKTAAQVDAMRSRPDLGFCHCGTENFGLETGDGPIPAADRARIDGSCFEAQFRRAGVMPSASLVRRSAAPAHGFCEDLGGFEDYAWFLELLVSRPCAYQPQVWTRMRRRAGQQTRQQQRLIALYEADARLRILDRLADRLDAALAGDLRQWTVKLLEQVAYDRYWHGHFAEARYGFRLLGRAGRPARWQHRLRAAIMHAMARPAQS